MLKKQYATERSQGGGFHKPIQAMKGEDLYLRIKSLLGLHSLPIPKYLKKVIRKLLSYEKEVIKHDYPNEKLEAELFQLLMIKNIDSFSKQHNLDKQISQIRIWKIGITNKGKFC